MFQGVSSAFGWPAVKTYSVIHAQKTAALKEARYFSREILTIAPHTDLGKLQITESEIAQAAVAREGELTAVTAFEPTTWTVVRAHFWGERPAESARPGTQLYVVGYLATSSK